MVETVVRWRVEWWRRGSGSRESGGGGGGVFFFFFNDTATTEIYTLSLHDALPILCALVWKVLARNLVYKILAYM